MQQNKKSIIISGGSSGIGLATCLKFAEQDWEVFNLDVKGPTDKMPDNIHWHTCDITQWEKLEATVALISKAENIQIEGLFVNAGMHAYGTVDETTNETFEKIMNVNIRGTFYLLKAVLPIMKQQKNGSVVICASEQVQQVKPKSAAYGMSKAAISHLARTSALDAGPDGIRVNAICPGPTQAPMYTNTIEAYVKSNLGVTKETREKEIAANIPLGRIAKAEDVANLVYFLCSDQARYLSGAVIPITGGK